MEKVSNEFLPEVSIVMACYNSERWIEETIDSVQSQTYKNWELLITDDGSSDNSVNIIQKFICKDDRIKLYCFSENRGAAQARNNSLYHARGRYISFFDSDDLWTPSKLDHQLEFMKKDKIAMCYTDYDIINESGEYKKTIHVPEKINYDGYLKKPVTCTHTVMFDSNLINKDLLQMPNIRRGQDGATWLKILKTGVIGHGLGESLAKYRRHDGSLSNNKLKAIGRVWYLYRKVEKLSIPYSCTCFVSYVLNAIKKYS